MFVLLTSFMNGSSFSAMVWPRNQTRSVVDLISPDERTTLMSAACQLRYSDDDAHVEPPSLLVMVESSLPNTAMRDVVRRSWARPSLVPDSRAKVTHTWIIDGVWFMWDKDDILTLGHCVSLSV